MIRSKEYPVSIQRDEKYYFGFYLVNGDMITVHSKYGDKTAQLSTLSPRVLAETLFCKIIEQNVKE